MKFAPVCEIMAFALVLSINPVLSLKCYNCRSDKNSNCEELSGEGYLRECEPAATEPKKGGAENVTMEEEKHRGQAYFEHTALFKETPQPTRAPQTAPPTKTVLEEEYEGLEQPVQIANSRRNKRDVEEVSPAVESIEEGGTTKATEAEEVTGGASEATVGASQATVGASEDSTSLGPFITCRKIIQALYLKPPGDLVTIRECGRHYIGDQCIKTSNKLVYILACDCKNDGCNSSKLYLATVPLLFICAALNYFM